MIEEIREFLLHARAEEYDAERIISEGPAMLDRGRTGVSGRPAKYPWRSIIVGDLFEVPGGNIKTLAPLAAVTGRKLGRKFRVYQDDGTVIIERVA